MRRLPVSRLIAVVLAGVVSIAPGAASSPAASREPTVNAIAIDPSTPTTIYVGTTGGLAVSDDAGRTWMLRPLDPRDEITALAIDPRAPSGVWAGTGHDLRRTEDRGVTWTIMRTPPWRMPLGIRLFAALFDFYAGDLERAAAASASGQYRFGSVVVLPDTPEIVLAGAPGVLRSADGGARWRRMPVTAPRGAPEVPFIAQLVGDPHDPRRVWALTDGGVALRSRDAGETWQALDVSPYTLTSLVADPDVVDGLYAGTRRAGVIRSVDAGASWTPLGSPVTGAAIIRVAVTGRSRLFASVRADRSDGGLFWSDDGGVSWTRALRRDWATPAAIAVDPRDPATMYAGGDGGLWTTADGGAHWRRVRLRPASRVDGTGANLVPTGFAAHGLALTFSVTNTGDGPVPPGTHVSHTVYLSSDDVLSGDDHAVGDASWSDGIAAGATYPLHLWLTAPPVPAGGYFLILQVDEGGTNHVDDAKSARVIPFAVTTDFAMRLQRVDALYAQGMLGAEEYTYERRALLQFMTPPEGW